MASVEKFKHSAVRNQLRHNMREIRNDSNLDIDRSLSINNYTITPPGRTMSPWEYYTQRKSELFVCNRDDVNTMCSWVVTCPKELTEEDEKVQFFEATYKFLELRYGKENTIAAFIHVDEGKREKVKDRFTGEILRDKETGKPITNLIYGSDHMHYCFIPVSEHRHSRRNPQTEKICANDVITPVELRRFHGELQDYLNKNTDLNCKVLTGITKAQGRNYTVAEMKENYEKDKELERLREIEKKYEHERKVSRNDYGRWG